MFDKEALHGMNLAMKVGCLAEGDDVGLHGDGSAMGEAHIRFPKCLIKTPQER